MFVAAAARAALLPAVGTQCRTPERAGQMMPTGLRSGPTYLRSFWERAMAEAGLPHPDASMAWNTVARYASYEKAQEAVDRLSDEHFPVENLEIVGSGLRLVERVTGRLTKARAAAAGAATGAWFGLFIGLLVGLFTAGPTWIGLIVGGLLIGAAWGAVFGFAGHAATRGRRDFSSAQTLTASRYDIMARGGTSGQARSILQQAGMLPDRPADQQP